MASPSLAYEDRSPEVYRLPEDDTKEPPFQEIDYRSQGGPKLTFLWCEDEPLHGQSLYLGGEVGSDGKVWFIPGHASRVLCLDPNTDKLQQVGPIFSGKFKWLRGIVVGDIIYGLPCNHHEVLRINVRTREISTLTIPYQEFYQEEQVVNEQSRQPWKYHGGNVSPVDGCIYAIPQSAKHVLKIDPFNDTCSLIGPELPGKYKWYGGLIGTTDGAIYGILHNSPHVLRIHPEEGVTLHGDYGTGGHKWHGASVSGDGTIVCVPANADTVLCIQPGQKPTMYEIGDAECIRTGRHRQDRKYKYLGAMTGPDGKVYIFPSGSEEVLQVDTAKRTVQPVGPNIYDANMERLSQNKWQNGLVSDMECAVYGIPLAAESLLRIDCSVDPPAVSTWPLPSPHRGLAKFEGGVVAPNGILYTVPNNHKAVLRIEPATWAEKHSLEMPRKKPEDTSDLTYSSGIPTLRSSAHRVKFNIKNRKHDPCPRNRHGEETGTLWLPSSLLKEHLVPWDTSQYHLQGALVNLLDSCDASIVGSFLDGSKRLEDFRVTAQSTWRQVNGGQCEDAQKYLSEQVECNDAFLLAFDDLVVGVALPWLKAQLVKDGALQGEDEPVTFYYQRPPTIRLQPGPAWSQVKAHRDSIYGHQNGELNFWLPLTDRELTGVDLYCETSDGSEDYHVIPAKIGEIISFHGSSCRHFVNANESENTRVSLDFRVGVQGYFDPYWQMKGTTDDHGRREATL